MTVRREGRDRRVVVRNKKDCLLGFRWMAGNESFVMHSAVNTSSDERPQGTGCKLGQQVECVLAYARCWLTLMDYSAIKEGC